MDKARLRYLQAGIILILLILVALNYFERLGTTPLVIGVSLAIASLAVTTTFECTKVGAKEVRGAEPVRETDFETLLKQKYKGPHAHQEACRALLEAFTGLEFVELSGAKPLPKGKHIRATSDELDYWHDRREGKLVYLDLDAWNSELQIAMEYRGPVHDEVEKVMENDRIKERLAQKHELKLLIPHYEIPAEAMSRYIYTKLVEWKVPLVHGIPRFAPLSEERMRQLDWHNPKRREMAKCRSETSKKSKRGK